MKYLINRQEVDFEKFKEAILVMRLEEESSDLGLLYLRAFIESYLDKTFNDRVKQIVAAYETQRLFKNSRMVVVNNIIFEVEQETKGE